MIVSKFLMTGIPAAALIACTPFLHAAPQEEADIPSMTRTWTNKETGATFQARLAGLNSVNAIMQNVFTKKKIPFPLKKLSREDLDWIDFHKELVGKTDAELAKMVIPKGVLGKQLKGLTYREKDGKFVKMDGKWNARYFILYYSASWCGPCRASLRDWGEVFRQAVLRAREVLAATGDPQQADLVLVDANGNKIASGSMDGLVRKVEELASAEKEKEATAESE